MARHEQQPVKVELKGKPPTPPTDNLIRTIDIDGRVKVVGFIDPRDLNTTGTTAQETADLL